MVVRGKEPDVDDIFDNAPGAVADNAETPLQRQQNEDPATASPERQDAAPKGRGKGKARKAASVDPGPVKPASPASRRISTRERNQAIVRATTILRQRAAAIERVELAEADLDEFCKNLLRRGFSQEDIDEIIGAGSHGI